jgi:hypothetical protein
MNVKERWAALFSLAKNDKFQPLFVYRRMPFVSSPAKGTIDIVLSPEFYVLRKESLGVRSAYAAKRIAASVMAPYVEPAETLRYFVFPCNEAWCFVAYDLHEIEAFLHEKGISFERVGKIYFAQQFVDHLAEPVAIDDKHLLMNVDEIATFVPFVSNEAYVADVEKIFDRRPKRAVVPERPHTFVSMKTAMTVAFVAIGFAVVWVAEGMRYEKGADEIRTIYETVVRKYPDLSDGYIREATLRKYETLDRNERRKRKIVQTISNMTSKKTKLLALTLEDKQRKVTARFSCDDKKETHILKRRLQREGFRVKTADQETELTASKRW